jgi:tripartite motif-containing protein 71
MGLYKRHSFLLLSSILSIAIFSSLNGMLPYRSYAQTISPGGEIGGGSLGPSITLDRYGSIYVADSGSHKIQKFNGAGKFLAGWGLNGTANGQFTGPLSITSDIFGSIYVADSGSHKIQKFNGAGKFLAGWGLNGTANGQFTGPLSITSDPTGKILVADSGSHKIQIFNGAGKFLAGWVYMSKPAGSSGGGESTSQSSIPGLGF